ncbi:MAG: AAA family ATPase [Polynucleobacter sp.]|nr:AAA family ATPase [Polynucleobacter sp.]
MSIELARNRLSQLYQFFKAVEERRTPRICDFNEYRWKLELNSLPKHPKLILVKPSPDNGEWLTIYKPKLTDCPAYPQSLNDWLDKGWDDPIFEITPKVKSRVIQRGNEFVEIEFDASVERINDYAEWSIKRNLWRSVELPARQVVKVWERFFSLHNDLTRDGESWELMVGDGLVSYKHGGQNLFHPLVLRKVELVFNPNALEFKIIDTDARPELYSQLFANDEFSGLPVKKWQESLEYENLHPLDDEKFNYFLSGLTGLIKDSEFINEIPNVDSSHFIVGRNPVLFLRARPTGRVEYIDLILNDIPSAEAFPTSLLGIVGLFNPEKVSEPDESSAVYANEQLDVLLTKPANAEQVEILRKLSKRDGVLVQGPPGTGKTHTIANLIGNFLSEGKSVLVTSHTTKALRVLRGQVAKPLQSLCVSLLDSDAQSRLERELAIRELATKLSDNPTQYCADSLLLKTKREKILQSLMLARANLLKIVGSEYKPLVISGKEVDPAQAAREVASGYGVLDWIPGAIDDAAPVPINDIECRQLYAISRRITSLEDTELNEKLPELDSLPSEETFKEWVALCSELQQSDLSFRRDLWTIPSGALSSLEDLYKTVNEQVGYISKFEGEEWKLAVIQAGIELNVNAEVWKLLCENIGEVRKLAQEAARAIFEYGPRLSTHSTAYEQLQVLIKIEQHFKNSNGISWIKATVSGWVRFIESWQVKNKSPNTADDFYSLKKLAELTVAREELVEKWQRLMAPLGGESLENLAVPPEDFSYQFVDSILGLLAWYTKNWQPVEKQLIDQGLNWSDLLSESPPSNSTHHVAERLVYAVQNILPNVLNAETKRRIFAQLELKLSEVIELLNLIQKNRKISSALIESLITAIQSRSYLAYTISWQRLAQLNSLKPDFILRNQLLDRLKPFAPKWTSMLLDRLEHDVPALDTLEIAPAWRWLQLNQELVRRSELSLEDVQNQVRQLTDLLQNITVELVEKLAWAGLLEKVTNEQRQALLGWSAIVKRIGAGSGKLVPALQRQAQIEMEKARGAVPVWIMPFSQVTRSFHPIRDKFDVIIIDEASQEDVLGLVPFYMAEKVIVVGDDEQVTPLDVGGQQGPIQHLINQWLTDMPSPNLFDLKTSVYDRAQIAFGSVIRLKEHFRCVPEIIQFSNSLCYNYTIKPLRESSSTVLKPALVAHRVDGSSEDKINKIEANEIANLISACIELPEYAQKTFGVITMVGEKQADLINEMLRARLDPVDYEQRRILCGNPAQFQGDERDVIFLSLVDSKEDGEGPLSLRQDGADGLWKKRFNVASSRAKDQLWVVHSLDSQTQLKPNDVRRRLIEHAIDPSNLMNTLEAGLTKTESPFEAEVFKILSSKGFKVTPQWQVGAYRIDLVVVGGGKRLAVECDGERWHYDKAEEDLSRQALLERLGWTFVRIRGSVFYKDRSPGRDAAITPVLAKLNELGIFPDNNNDNLSPIQYNYTLIDAVKLKASELRVADKEQFSERDVGGRFHGG